MHEVKQSIAPAIHKDPSIVSWFLELNSSKNNLFSAGLSWSVSKEYHTFPANLLRCPAGSEFEVSAHARLDLIPKLGSGTRTCQYLPAGSWDMPCYSEQPRAALRSGAPPLRDLWKDSYCVISFTYGILNNTTKSQRERDQTGGSQRQRVGEGN